MVSYQISILQRLRNKNQSILLPTICPQKLFEPLKVFADELSSIHIRTDIKEALTDPKWVQAIKEEMDALLRNETRTLVSLPEGKKTVECKWIFSIKYKADGLIDRYKARLAAKGYMQTYDVDY